MRQTSSRVICSETSKSSINILKYAIYIYFIDFYWESDARIKLSLLKNINNEPFYLIVSFFHPII